LPEYINIAYRHAMNGRMGPSYLDLPGDVLYSRVDEDDVVWPEPAKTHHRSMGDAGLVTEAVNMLSRAERPLIVSGTGIIWADAAAEMQQFVDETGIPFFTTPQGRGVVPEDHPRCFLSARSLAFREADVILFLATRFNYVISHGQAPRFNADAKTIQVNIDPTEIGRNRPVDVGIAGDAKAVLRQMLDLVQGKFEPQKETAWIAALREQDLKGQARLEPLMHSDEVPIHPLRLCKEINDFLTEDTVFIGDGGDIVTMSASVIRTHKPGHWLDPGPLGTLGVGAPFAIAAKAAMPEKDIFVLFGDGAFGLTGFDIDTAVRFDLPFVSVVGNNAGWNQIRYGQLAKYGEQKGDVANKLFATRYDVIVEAMGGYGECVTEPGGIRPAMERARASGKPSCVNVILDPDIYSSGTMNQTMYK
jgi:acetolactate synthase-1/2/3 large subunit